jgi:hypothetical protein
MAQSLVCKDCGVFLRSVKEAQDHSEITSHINFEETTVAIKTLVCKDCGKRARTDAERDQHTRFTGHASFEEEAGHHVLDSEKEMKEAKHEMDVDNMEATVQGVSDEGTDGAEKVRLALSMEGQRVTS